MRQSSSHSITKSSGLSTSDAETWAATLRGGRSANRIGAGVVAVARMVGWLPILRGDAGIAFAVALTLGTIAALMFGVPRLSGPPRESSRQLIFLARAIMVLLVLAVTVDLVRAGWSLF